MKDYTITYEVSTSSGLNVWKDLIASVELLWVEEDEDR